MNHYILPIKPKFAKLILQGSKGIELRRGNTKITKGDIIVIYSSSPECRIVGRCIVKRVTVGTPTAIYRKFKQAAGVTRMEFYEYYNGTKKASAIAINNVERFDPEIPLKKLREIFPQFVIPQSYRRLQEHEVSTLVDSSL